MAYSIDSVSEQNVDTPLSIFPVDLDAFEKKSDLTIDTLNLANQYDSYFRAGNYSLCVQLIKDNPDFAKTQLTADDYNKLVDAIIAMEHYLLNQVEKLVEETVQANIGINDSPTKEEASLAAYSAEKINRLHNVRKITLSKDAWSNSYPYTQTVQVEGVLETDTIKIIGAYHASGNSYDEDKAIDKAMSFLMYVEDGVADGAITFKAKKLPTIDFTVITEGG